MIAVAKKRPRRSPERRFLRLGEVAITVRELPVSGRAGTSWTMVRTLVAVAVLAPAAMDTLGAPPCWDAATGATDEATAVAVVAERAGWRLASRGIAMELLLFGAC